MKKKTINIYDNEEPAGFIGQVLLMYELKAMNISELERTRYIINKLIKRKVVRNGSIRNTKLNKEI